MITPVYKMVDWLGNMSDNDFYLVFFLIQQFITWSTIAVCGSYFVTTYIETNYMENKMRK